MNSNEYQQMYELEASHWYFVAKRRLIEDMLIQYLRGRPPGRILDVGCGTGEMMRMLGTFGEAVGIDCSPQAIEFCRRRGLERVLLASVEDSLCFEDACFDVVCAFDLLEHVEGDEFLMKEMARVCRPGGLILTTVPAFEFLWTEHDDALHHKRRYTRKEVARLFAGARVELVKLTYANTLLFPLALSVRMARRMLRRGHDEPRSEFFIQLPGPLNTGLWWIFQSERWLLRWLDFPVGVSVLGIGRRLPAAQPGGDREVQRAQLLGAMPKRVM